MPQTPKQKTGPSVEGLWNDQGSLERVEMILQYPDHFLMSGLVTREELKKVMACTKTEWEYLITRDPNILFHDIDITKKVSTQEYRKQLKDALKASFLKTK